VSAIKANYYSAFLTSHSSGFHDTENEASVSCVLKDKYMLDLGRLRMWKKWNTHSPSQALTLTLTTTLSP